MSLDLLADSAFSVQPLQPISHYKKEQNVIAEQLSGKRLPVPPVEQQMIEPRPLDNIVGEEEVAK